MRVCVHQFHADISQLGIEFQAVNAALAANSRLLGAAERGAQIAKKPSY